MPKGLTERARMPRLGRRKDADYVQNSFASRHPLKNTFRTLITEIQYRAILGKLSDEARRDVQEAIDLINRHGAMIGVKPFDGKQAPRIQMPAVSLMDEQAFRAAARARMERW